MTLYLDLPFIPKLKATREFFEIIKEKKLDYHYFIPTLEMNLGIKNGRTGKYRLETDYPVFDEEGQKYIFK